MSTKIAKESVHLLKFLEPEGAVKARLAEYERAVREAYCRISPD